MNQDRINKTDQVKDLVGNQYRKLTKISFEFINVSKQKMDCAMSENERTELLQRLRKEVDDYKNYNIKLNDDLEDQLNDELSQFENKQALHEIF